MNSYSEPTPEQETVGGGAESIPDPVSPAESDPSEVTPDDDDISSGHRYDEPSGEGADLNNTEGTQL